MKNTISLFSYLLFFVNNLYSQKTPSIHELLTIKTKYIPLNSYIGENIIMELENSKINTYSYSYNNEKSFVVYKDSTSPENITTTYILKKLKIKNRLRLDIVEDNEIVDNLEVKLIDSKKTIIINQDVYLLNTKYYIFLKKEVLKKNDISDLIDLIDNLLGDYPYQLRYLKYFSSCKKYSNNNFKILEAKIITKRTQNHNYKDYWTVNFSYNIKGVLKSLEKKSTEGNTGFYRKLIQFKNNIYKYSDYYNIESRYEDETLVTFNLNKTIYYNLNKHFQFGLNKEINYKDSLVGRLIKKY